MSILDQIPKKGLAWQSPLKPIKKVCLPGLSLIEVNSVFADMKMPGL